MSVIPNTSVNTVEKVATKKEFLKLPENSKIRKELNGAAILCYICAGVTLLVCLATGSFSSLLDVVILVGLGLGIHLAKSKVCAIILTVYGAINMILITSANGSLGGWLPLAAGIFALIYTIKLSKAWKAYNT